TVLQLRILRRPPRYSPGIDTEQPPSREDTPMHQPHSPGPPFPTQLAFVVQFGAETAVGRAQFSGRVGHIGSGRVTHFHTPEELWAFMRRMLTVQDSALEEMP